MSSNSLDLVIDTLKTQKETLTSQLTTNSEIKNLENKYSSNEIGEINARYGAEKEMVRNEIESLDDESSSEEYADLMTELKELDSKENDEVEAVETDIHNREEDLDLENTNLQTRVEAIEADIESFETMRDEAIEDEYGYFQ